MNIVDELKAETRNQLIRVSLVCRRAAYEIERLNLALDAWREAATGARSKRRRRRGYRG